MILSIFLPTIFSYVSHKAIYVLPLRGYEFSTPLGLNMNSHRFHMWNINRDEKLLIIFDKLNTPVANLVPRHFFIPVTKKLGSFL